MNEEYYKREIAIRDEIIKTQSAYIKDLNSKTWPDFIEWLREIDRESKIPIFQGNTNALKEIHRISSMIFHRINN